MVIMGSMNMNKGGAVGPGGKNKSKKVTGIGGTTNLKKNKLAIAFNNLEVEQNDKDSWEWASKTIDLTQLKF